MIKFRSMYVDAEDRLAKLADQNESDGLLFKISDDPRITPVGPSPAAYSIDELPQLLNVLRGEMSLVGPRPPLPGEVAHYRTTCGAGCWCGPASPACGRSAAAPTCPGTTRCGSTCCYVENWSLIYDFEILWKTFYAVLRGAGAY